MADSFSGKLQLWSGARAGSAHDFALAPTLPAATALTLRLVAAEVFGGMQRIRAGAEPFSLQWFLDVEHARHARHGRWIPHLLEFQKHKGETLLCMGAGLGTDWVQYARNGAEVCVCSSSQEQLALVQRNFSLRGFPGQFLHAGPSTLPLRSASIDVVCLTGLLQETTDPQSLADEIYRVLKPGGKVLAVTPAYYDIDFWCRSWLPWTRASSSPTGPVAYSRWTIRRLFGPFVEHRVRKRQLRRSEVPHICRWLPLPILERMFGRVLVLKAFKPLSAAMSLQAAA